MVEYISRSQESGAKRFWPLRAVENEATITFLPRCLSLADFTTARPQSLKLSLATNLTLKYLYLHSLSLIHI
jgi:hypothetical protein